jgi:hypothetical protein
MKVTNTTGIPDMLSIAIRQSHNQIALMTDELEVMFPASLHFVSQGNEANVRTIL